MSISVMNLKLSLKSGSELWIKEYSQQRSHETVADVKTKLKVLITVCWHGFLQFS